MYYVLWKSSIYLGFDLLSLLPVFISVGFIIQRPLKRMSLRVSPWLKYFDALSIFS